MSTTPPPQALSTDAQGVELTDYDGALGWLRALGPRGRRAFAGAFGAPICITDSYRTYAAQVRLYGQKPALAAVPGTSNHGWGLAVDLCGGIEAFGTPQYAWMTANSGRFGFLHPTGPSPARGARSPGTGSTRARSPRSSALVR